MQYCILNSRKHSHHPAARVSKATAATTQTLRSPRRLAVRSTSLPTALRYAVGARSGKRERNAALHKAAVGAAGGVYIVWGLGDHEWVRGVFVYCMSMYAEYI